MTQHKWLPGTFRSLAAMTYQGFDEFAEILHNILLQIV